MLGVVMTHDADLEWAERERKLRFILASRYLEEARADGFPPGRAGHGLYMLGKALHDAEQFAKCQPPLHAALTVPYDDPAAVHLLLTNAYLREADSPSSARCSRS